MSDNKPFKLNLGALKTNASDKNEETTESQNESVEISDKKENQKVKTIYEKGVSSPLSKIFDSEKEDKIEIIEEVKSEIVKEDINEDSKNEIKEESKLEENKIENETKEEEKVDIKKSNVLDFSKMQSNKQEKNKRKEEQKIIEETTENKNEIKEEEKDLFNNYESEFDKQKESILEKVKKFSDYIKPKTRVGFLALIIFITALGITSLFTLAPDKHNLDNYQANLLIAKDKIECKFDETKCKKEEKKQIPNKTTTETKTEINELNKQTLNKGLFAIEYETKSIDGKEIIIYNGVTYNDKESFNKAVTKEINIRKLNELKKHILKNK